MEMGWPSCKKNRNMFTVLYGQYLSAAGKTGMSRVSAVSRNKFTVLYIDSLACSWENRNVKGEEFPGICSLFSKVTPLSEAGKTGLSRVRSILEYVHCSSNVLLECSWENRIVKDSVADPDPSDPYVYGPPLSGSGSISQRYGSASGSFYHQAKK
jgi:hypothetical protein